MELKIAHAWCKLELGNPCHVALAQCAAKHEGQAHWQVGRGVGMSFPYILDQFQTSAWSVSRK